MTTLLPKILAGLLLGWALAAPASSEEPPPDVFAVNYVSATSIYVSGGREAGLAVGDLLEVVREDAPIAELRITYVATRSASCEIVESRGAIEPGDRVRMLKKAAPPPEEDLPEPGLLNTVKVEKARVVPVETREPEIIKPSRNARSRRSGLVTRPGEIDPPWARLTGTASLRLQSFADAAFDRDFSESTERLSLRLREIGGRPFDAHVRLRSRQLRRDPDRETERRDRLYEFSLIYDPPEGPFSFVLGRIGASPFATLGYLDGFVGQFRLRPKLSLGAFYGTRPEIEELGFASSGTKYGGFFKWNHRSRESDFFAEVLVAGVGEYEGGEVDREYVAVESRFGSGGRWRFYQRAEIDLNSDWRKSLSGESYQVSNLSLSGSFRASQFFRISLSYDQRRRFRTLETREIPEERFDDLLRAGFRLTLNFGNPRGWNASTTFGYRDQEGDAEATYSFSGGIHNSNFLNKNLLVSANISAFRGEMVEGYLLTLQVRKYLRGGHDVGVTVGASTTTVAATGGFLGSERGNQWVRLQATARLPWRFFLLGEFEITSGDDLEGQRLILELGYRF